MARDCRIYITGASCAGVTTLGCSVAKELGVLHVDVDDYFWMSTNPPYTTKRRPEERVRLIQQQLGERGWILSGSFDGWGDELTRNVDLIVFVATPTAIRLERLKARESERHGSRILPGGDMHAIHKAFYRWASQYDVSDFAGRSRSRHKAWLAVQRVPVIFMDGSMPTDELMVEVVSTADRVAQAVIPDRSSTVGGM